MNRYENGKIYQIVDVAYNKCYIGSTCESLSKRMNRHKHNYKQYLLGKQDRLTSFYMFDEVGIENCKIELLEAYPCCNKEELQRREGHYIKNNPCVNKVVPLRTPEEWYNDNRAKALKQFQHYHENNKEAVRQRKGEKITCECGDVICRNHKRIHVQSKRHHDNLQKPEQYIQKETYVCSCGSSIQCIEKSRHEKSKKHQDWMKQQKQEME